MTGESAVPAQTNKRSSFHPIIGVALAVIMIGGAFLVSRDGHDSNHSSPTLIPTASAHEIYPIFMCPCCGKPIDSDCCPMAQERKAYADELAQSGLSKDEIMLAYVKKYGLDSFKDAELKDEFKVKLASQAPAERPVISLGADSYNFGDLSQKNGVAKTSFEIKNRGSVDLEITKLETSCGCTSASITYNGSEGPRFAMPGHGINEAIGDWEAIIPPGDAATLNVYYDPNVHPDFRGTAIREIYIFSNDPIDLEEKVTVELNQID